MLGAMRLRCHIIRHMTWRYARATATSGRGTLFSMRTRTPFSFLSLVDSPCNTDELLHCILCIHPVTLESTHLTSLTGQRKICHTSGSGRTRPTTRVVNDLICHTGSGRIDLLFKQWTNATYHKGSERPDLPYGQWTNRSAF